MDINTLAYKVVQQSIGEETDAPKPLTDPKLVNRGKRRAAVLSPERRSEIAKAAAMQRWHSPKQ